MKKWKAGVLLLVVISLVASIGLWQTWGNWRAEEDLRYQAESQVEAYKAKLNATEIELSEKQSSFNKLETEFGAFKLKTVGDLRAVDTALRDTQSQLKNAASHVALVASELQGVRTEKENQRTYYEAKLAEALKSGKAGDVVSGAGGVNPLRNPTYDELVKFLAKNQVSHRAWIPGKYVCVDFAADINNDAEDAGFRSAYVWIIEGYGSNGSKWGHLLNGFQTVDKGLIFIEPQTDAYVDVKIGGRYYPYIQDTIKEIIIIW